MSELLKLEHLGVAVGEKQILKDVSMTIAPQEVHVLMGPNGAGKSTLGNAIMGNPLYTVTNGQMLWKGENLLEKTPDQRAKDGIFLSFQSPIEVPGITLGNFIRNALEQRTGKHIRPWLFQKELTATMEKLDMDPSYAQRDLNVGFSGGEKKKAEILQLLMLKPELAILDETDSGLDVDAVKIVSLGISLYREQTGGALLIITHSTKLVEAFPVSHTHILADGRFVANGTAELITEVNEHGFERYLTDGKDE